ncbi:hypothetical protein T440DRAFT_221977 [Plenodomus tracheiphilus IPT5]|uniref:Zn(2)-C6 fungal-type domain-containing protein n=1 Tax=Plenodomus tracheiphilus IPT5 TaxID=1408161 RepID=A0A6A7AV77_9PLEO|nr:hypothetical protein T440DRAFT_221977 [Plenodomus tracheiphilus IPT5]
MRAKRKNVCQECRSRKLACDGKQPACSQCVVRKLSCSGYRQEFLFVQVAQKPDSKSSQRTASSQTSGILERGTQTPSLVTTLEEDIRFIVQLYAPLSSCAPAKSNPYHNQICGSWVEVLPDLPPTAYAKPCLSSAVRAMATALRCHSMGVQMNDPEMLKLYCDSLRLLNKAIQTAQGTGDIAICIAAMCLAVTDIVTPALDAGWHAHVGGVGKMVELMGPLPFNCGQEHTVFLGLRPLLLLSSILRRRSTFLMQDEWKMVPFLGQPVSIMQELLSKATKLPNLLERYDQLGDLSTTSNVTAMARLESELNTLLVDLRSWEVTLQSQAPYILYWTQPHRDLLLSHPHVLWFPDIMTASSLTHYWAFRIVAKKYAATLRAARLTRACFGSQPTTDHVGAGDLPILKLAGMICDSMPYMMQPETKLSGPGSMFFTLATAVQAFEEAEEDCGERLKQCKQILDALASVGIYFPDIAMESLSSAGVSMEFTLSTFKPGGVANVLQCTDQQNDPKQAQGG